MMCVLALLTAEYQRLCRLHTAVRMPEEAELLAIAKTAHGHFARWVQASAVDTVPADITAILDADVVQADGCASPAEVAALVRAIVALMPWRKGPFSLLGEGVDSEWRSDWKYRRLLDLGFDVNGKTVLDVGTGNGYFLYRLLGSGARLACGLDPSWHNFAQFLFLQRYLRQDAAVFLPATLEAVSLTGFDMVMTMGVLYHRRDPLAFLAQLRDTVKLGGQVVVETLVVEGDAQTVYMPDARYAGMRNVWFLPSTAALSKWLQRLNFSVLAVSEAVATSSAEQRRTRHMQSHSLAEFMVEHGEQPPPKRAMIIAERR